MQGVCELGETLAAHLKERGLQAVTAWTPERRTAPEEAVAAVSLRGMKSGPPGFQDYLGEWYDKEKGRWVERYGKRVELVFGLDIHAVSAGKAREGLDRMSLILGESGPVGMGPVELTVGELDYEEKDRRYVCPVEGRFPAWLVRTGEETEASFLGFEVRGEREI